MREMLLVRDEFRDNATLGRITFCDYTCETLEDRYRPPGEAKVWGQTCIPCGRYRVVVTVSPKFKRELPRLLDVPNFTGILIHAGNTPADTTGCILVGLRRMNGILLDSRKALVPLMALIKAAQADPEGLWLTIRNAPENAAP